MFNLIMDKLIESIHTIKWGILNYKYLFICYTGDAVLIRNKSLKIQQILFKCFLKNRIGR